MATNWPLALVLFVLLVVGANVMIQRVVEYRFKVEIAVPVKKVYDAIRLQANVIQWSIRPHARSIVYDDGTVGAKRVLVDRWGRETASHIVSDLVENRKITFHLSDQSPFACQDQAITFLLHDTGVGTTVETLYVNRIRPPFHVVIRSAGLPEFVHDQHRSDLLALKRFLEDPTSFDTKKEK